MALSDPHASQHGTEGCSSRLLGIRPNGEHINLGLSFETISRCIHDQDAPDELEAYSHKRCADDIKALANHLGESKVILGGHDW